MIILEENFKWHLEAFASELFMWSFWQFVKNCIIVKSRRVSWPGCKNKESMRSLERSGDD